MAVTPSTDGPIFPSLSPGTFLRSQLIPLRSILVIRPPVPHPEEPATSRDCSIRHALCIVPCRIIPPRIGDILAGQLQDQGVHSLPQCRRPRPEGRMRESCLLFLCRVPPAAGKRLHRCLLLLSTPLRAEAVLHSHILSIQTHLRLSTGNGF